MRKYMKIRKILLIMLVLLLGFDFSVAVAQLNPPSLTANAVSSSQIDLSWTDPNNGEAGYQIERSLSPTSGFNVIAAVGKNVTSYRDNGLSSGTQYYYKVKVYKQKESVYSNTANATTLAPDTTPPSVSITIPPNNTTYTTAQTVTITASASDNVGVTKVEFYDGSTLKGTDITSPYNYSWSITSADNGTHNWTAKAYDAANNNSVSNVVSLIVNIPAADTTPPSVSITIPANNTTYTTAQTVTITASASDNVGVTKVEFYDNNSLKGTDITSPYNYSWSITSSDNGTHSWTAKAYDAAGNIGISSNVNLIVNINNPVGGEFIWTKRLGGTLVDAGCNVKTDNSGNIITAGYFMGTVDFGGGPLTSAGGYDIFVAKYDSTGQHIWSKRFGSSEDDSAKAVAVDASGNVLVTGYFMGTVNFGGATLTSLGMKDIFVAKYSSTGAFIWAKSFGYLMSDDIGYDVAVDSSGNVIVTGSFTGFVDFGGGYLQSDPTGPDTFLAKFSPTGAHIWSKNFLSTAWDEGYSISVDDSGNVFITGSFSYTVDFGGGKVTSVGSSKDIYVAKYSSTTGAHMWSKQLGGSGNDIGYSVAVDSSGNVVITGYFSGTVDFGGGPLTSAGSYDIFVAKYSSSGAHLWSKRFGSTSLDSGNSVSVDRVTNEVIITGYFVGTVDFGGGPMTSTGSYDIFVAKYSSTGAHMWSKRFGSTSADMGYGVATDVVGNIVTTGYFVGTVDFGGGPLTSAGSYDIFLLKLGP
jgi:chitodextrinase